MKGTNSLIVTHAQMCEIVQEWLKYKFSDDEVVEVGKWDLDDEGHFKITVVEKTIQIAKRKEDNGT